MPTSRADSTSAPQSASRAFSVVLGSVNSARTIARSIAALRAACDGLDAEIIVIDASEDETIARVRTVCPEAIVRRFPPGTLMPRLWSAGFALARGRVVAFTTGQCIVSEGWAKALLWQLDSGATGVAGPLSPAADCEATDWALFHLRYSAFLDDPGQATRVADEIPGDNAAYTREALERHASTFAGGFWEVDFHRRLRAEPQGARLVLDRGASVQLGPSGSFPSLLRQRFAHGRHSGAWRVECGARRAWQVAAFAPLVPFLLAARVGRRVLPRPLHRTRFLASLPAVLALASAWAAGEAHGALTRTRALPHRNPGIAV